MNRKRVHILLLPALLMLLYAPAFAGPFHDHVENRPPARSLQSLADHSSGLLSMAEVWRVATLRNYNTRLVVLSTTLLGAASGLIGTFLLLRKRSLMGDALSHACLPGIGLAFMISVAMDGTGKNLPILLLGASVTGLAGVGLVMLIHNTTRIKDDAAMGIVLSVFFGLGVALLGMIQTAPGASAAGLENFIYGKTASMVMQDFLLIATATVGVLLCASLFTKELTLLCFDEDYADAQGWPVHALDILMLAMVALVTVVGLQAVGLILIIAFLITPAAAARFWTHDLRHMLWLAAMLGGVSGWLGASISALLPRLPAGAVIVLVAAGVFVVSMIFGSSRGVLLRLLSLRRLRHKVGSQHLLRAVYEILETQAAQEGQPVVNKPIDVDQLLGHRSWSRARLYRLIRRAKREDHIDYFDGRRLCLTESGFGQAARITRNHRLWEMYLIRYADIAPAHVDRDADTVEHVLAPDMVRQLEDELHRRNQLAQVPPSPHVMPTPGGGS